MYEISGSQFLRNTTRIKSGPDIFGKAKLAMILGVTEILRYLRLVLGEKTGKKLPEPSRLGFLEKLLARNCALSDAEENISGTLNRAGIADTLLLRTLLTIHQNP